MKSTGFHGLPLNALFFIHEIQYRNTFRGLGLPLNMQCIYKKRIGLLVLGSFGMKSVEEHTPPSQIPGLNLTQFNEVGSFRSNLLNKIPKRSNRACRAKNLLN